MNKIRLLGAVCACLTFVSMNASAVLIDRGGGLIYDDVLDITWMQDANYSKTNGDDADGLMFWDEAKTWAGGLSYYDSVRNVTYDDWRLATSSPIDGISFNTAAGTDGTTSDWGFAATTTNGSDGGWRDSSGTPVSELGHMYYVNLANLGECDPSLPFCTEQTGWGLNNTGPFFNIMTDRAYYYGSELNASTAWGMFMSKGGQGNFIKGGVPLGLYSWAVRDGDVSAVPIPASVWLFGSGLLGLVGMARRKL